ncbi:glutamine--fructose-6-phosphate transaminase (isomerizing) [bacterium]|nr:glutamine--fructose-6-phosphate transaminase (isomerizing) [bacterium]
MCGIVGYTGKQKAVPILLDGLSRLEYRGYDSAGLAYINNSDISIVRAEGKLSNLSSKIDRRDSLGMVGIGHTRWATHGSPTETNAHPHRAGDVVLVHNGIIENYLSLKEKLQLKGHKILSETDTEIVCHLISEHLKKEKVFLKALSRALSEVEGTYALAVLYLKEPDKLYAAKKSSPLVIGLGKNENFLASDIPALLPYTKEVIYLENNEIAVLEKKGVTLYSKGLKKIVRKAQTIPWNADMAKKDGFKHYMLKEIHEQPQVVSDTMMGHIKKGAQTIDFKEIDSLFKGKKYPFYNRIYIIACGTSWHAALAGKFYLEAIARLPVSVDTASEFRYREPFLDKDTLLISISQSGETADTLACVEEARSKGVKTISICNVIGSSLARASHATLYTHAGPEIGVASTKAFTTQLVVLLMLALNLGYRARKINRAYLQNAVKKLSHLPRLMESILARKDDVLAMAQSYFSKRDFYYIARGVHFPIALEGALKLKEISYIHAEGYSAGEMKHGPIALIEPGSPVVALAPLDRVCVKMLSNIEEVKARGASVIGFVTEGDKRFEGKCEKLFYVPKTVWYLTPILLSIPLQLLSYYIADLRGTDVDQPRNLAKSVTVE